MASNTLRDLGDAMSLALNSSIALASPLGLPTGCLRASVNDAFEGLPRFFPEGVA